MSSIMRRRRGLISAIGELLSEGWASKTRNPLRQEAAIATSQLPRQRLRSIPKRKKTNTHPRLSCKIEYWRTSNHSDGSVTSEFFTDDDGNRGDELHGVRCRNEARPGFVLKMPSSEVAHIEEGIGLLARRCCTRHSDPIYGDVRRPDAQPLVWMSVR